MVSPWSHSRDLWTPPRTLLTRMRRPSAASSCVRWSPLRVDMANVAEVVPVPVLTRIPRWTGLALPASSKLAWARAAGHRPTATRRCGTVTDADERPVGGHRRRRHRGRRRGRHGSRTPRLRPPRPGSHPGHHRDGNRPVGEGSRRRRRAVALLATDAVLRLREQLPRARRATG